VGSLARPLDKRIYVFGRAEVTRRANQLGADLISSSHSLLFALPEDFFAADLDDDGFGSAVCACCCCAYNGAVNKKTKRRIDLKRMKFRDLHFPGTVL